MRFLACVILLSVSLPLFAQSPEDASGDKVVSPAENTRALLKGQTGINQKLLGKQELHLNIQGTNFGTMTINIEEGKHGEQACYEVALNAKMKMGKATSSMDNSGKIDLRLQDIEVSHTSKRNDAIVKTSQTKRTKDGWNLHKTDREAEEKSKQDFSVDLPYNDLAVEHMFFCMLAAENPGKYEIADWDDDKSKWTTIQLDVSVSETGMSTIECTTTDDDGKPVEPKVQVKDSKIIRVDDGSVVATSELEKDTAESFTESELKKLDTPEIAVLAMFYAMAKFDKLFFRDAVNEYEVNIGLISEELPNGSEDYIKEAAKERVDRLIDLYVEKLDAKAQISVDAFIILFMKKGHLESEKHDKMFKVKLARSSALKKKLDDVFWVHFNESSEKYEVVRWVRDPNKHKDSATEAPVLDAEEVEEDKSDKENTEGDSRRKEE